MKKRRTLNIASYLDRFLSIRPRSEYEVRRRLLFKKYPFGEIEKEILRLNAAGMLDDRAFASAWIENRYLLRPSGKKLLVLELRQKGVDPAIIESSLTYSDEEEIELAQRAIESKVRLFSGLPEIKRRQKLISFLLRRGFSYSVAKKALATVDKNDKI